MGSFLHPEALLFEALLFQAMASSHSSQNQSEFIIVLVTAGSETEADKLASTLVENRLAACVNCFPIQSTYRWQGQIQRDREWQLTLKTQRDRFEAIQSLVRSLHSYEVPEIIAIPIEDGDVSYLDWLAKESSGKNEF